MGFENKFEKKGGGDLEKKAHAQRAAYGEMRDTIDAADYVSNHMKGLLNTWSGQDTTATKAEDVERHMSSDMEMLFRSTRDQLSRELRDKESQLAMAATIQARAELFAAIARKHGFAIDPNAL